MLLHWFTGLCSLFLFASHILSVPISAKRSLITEDVHQRITQLKEHGKTLLNQKHYQRAINYYSGMIFLVEGIKGSRATEIRQRCGLTLAECEMKLGRYSRAVARCSEVIEEASSEVDDLSAKKKSPLLVKRSKSLLRSLALAHYRRAICLKHLRKLSLAMIDLRLALKYQPDDNNILEEIVDTHFKNVTLEMDEEDVMMARLYDFVEDCQVSQPRLKMTVSLIDRLCAENPEIIPQSLTSPSSSSFFPGLGASLTGLGNPTPGLSSIGRALPDLKSMGNLFEMISGIDGETVSKAIEIVTAVTKVISKVKKTWSFLDQNKIPIIIVGSTAWILFTLLKFSFKN